MNKFFYVCIWFSLTLTLNAGEGFDPGKYIEKHSNSEITKRADQGDRFAESALGYMYLLGERVETNKGKAVFYLSRAASKGEAYAAFCLGNMYLYGRGVSKDPAKAENLIQIAADAGDVSAQEQLVFLFLKSGKVWTVTGKRMLEKLADGGDAEVMLRVGDAFMGKEYGAPNFAEGFKWYLMAANKGNVRGQLMAGRCLWYGVGIKANHALALEYIRKAIENGSIEAKEELSKLEKH